MPPLFVIRKGSLILGLQMPLHYVLATVADAVKQPYIACRPVVQGRVEHAEHRCDADAAADQDDWQPRTGLQVELSGGRPDGQLRADLDVLVEIV